MRALTNAFANADRQTGPTHTSAAAAQNRSNEPSSRSASRHYQASLQRSALWSCVQRSEIVFIKNWFKEREKEITYLNGDLFLELIVSAIELLLSDTNCISRLSNF